MNKTTFTRLLQNSTTISDADMLALEQVVQAFPYCHIGHMLLAKASHDKGSMMAPQRLRKAAIHAPSRAILKKLIESAPQTERQQAYARALSGAEAIAEKPDAQTHVLVPEYQEELEDLIDNDFPETGIADSTQTTETENSAREAQILPFPARQPATEDEERLTNGSVDSEEAAEKIISEGAVAETSDETIVSKFPANDLETALSEIALDVVAEVAHEIQELAAEAKIEEESPSSISPVSGLEETEEFSEAAETKVTEIDTFLEESGEAEIQETEPSEIITEEVETQEKESVITEPEEAANLNIEAITEETEPVIAVTPDTEEALLAHPSELTLEQPVASLALQDPTEQKTSLTQEQLYTDELIRTIFLESELGYSMSSSRLGECLQRKSELTTEVPFHFQPELLVEYTLSHEKPAEPEENAVLAQQEIINDFLKQASKGRNKINQAAKAEEQQQDLSSKSTKLNKSLVSENLAQIFAMQGKNKKAIKIYQQLQLKIPEKKDYFAAQIVKLQNIS